MGKMAVAMKSSNRIINGDGAPFGCAVVISRAIDLNPGYYRTPCKPAENNRTEKDDGGGNVKS